MNKNIRKQMSSTINSPIIPSRRIARIAGLLYLSLAITGSFGIMYIPSKFFGDGNPETAANNIVGNEMLFRIGLVNNLISLTIFVFLVLTLRKLLKEINQDHALLMVTLVVIPVSIGCLNILNLVAPLLILGEVDFLIAFKQDELNAWVNFFLRLYKYGIYIQELFWGLWLLPLGLLIFRSGFIPKIFGILLIIACFGWVLASFTGLLLPEERMIVSRIATSLSAIGEFSIILWLLAIGVKHKQPIDELT